LRDGSALPISARQESCRLFGELDEARRVPGETGTATWVGAEWLEGRVTWGEAHDAATRVWRVAGKLSASYIKRRLPHDAGVKV